MKIQHMKLMVKTNGQGLYECTEDLQQLLSKDLPKEGLCQIFLQHTSASLIIQENADPSAKRDLEQWMNRLVPENDPLYTHVLEGPDDCPAHIKSILTQTQLSVPIIEGRIALGTWQGVYLWEHRHAPQNRRLIVSVLG